MVQTHHRQVLGHATRRVPEHGHERATHAWVCSEIARLLGVRDAGVAGDGVIDAGTFHVPDDTLTTAQARGFGIHGADDLLGGIVPHAFLATKVIGHPLINDSAARTEGWNQALAASLIPATLPGFTVFSRQDAIHAFEALSGDGGVRLKLPTGVGGNDQWRVADVMQLTQVLDCLPDTYLATHGAVLERNILQPLTHSVGELCVAGIQVAYYGTQCSVPNLDGTDVYGGSALRVFRGSLEALMATALPPLEQRVVEQACRYDRFITAAYPELQISRRNYDVVSGEDAGHVQVCGVLEQSWRIGGATPAELAAVAAFQQDPALQWVTASTHEIYQGEPPADAQVYYRATQSGPGPRYKYRRVSAT
ncbi:TPA: DUF3182 family protein [Xanthomonas vasicola pv. zeae]|uniref:Uncharacterized protein n=2 Tax=Xanthomonas vasicola pv. vasculorum TaxID=325776 RepID=A0A836P1G0_XANVA|nr:DUF3182 family protein [Xanthomonas vasicola]KFA31158.1 hypothetical protein KWS_0115215 [Xanthomonas vasicola pv. musacearum NCPPB 4384]AVQ08587.1 DUF3182 domain-containing protein [Xanthomonas vasicola pv. vasculorum]AZM72783.1 DUF3182 domain-containing protein [Xanthomonas vasicola pv. vasculorum]AZR31998.1 DUF3182 family protein [Xanthomonas vasicola pv. musacearum NCPPB 4379]AZR36472.1 DUF3182 family protein [Xanthomonas vasicola]